MYERISSISRLIYATTKNLTLPSQRMRGGVWSSKTLPTLARKCGGAVLMSVVGSKQNVWQLCSGTAVSVCCPDLRDVRFSEVSNVLTLL